MRRRPGVAAYPNDPGLLRRCDPSKHGGASDRRAETGVVEPVDVGAGERSTGGRPRSAQSFVATIGLSPVMTLTVTPRSARRAQCGHRVRLRRIEEDQRSDQVQVDLVGGGDAVAAGSGTGSHRDDPVSGREFVSSAADRSAGVDLGQRR